MTQQIGQLVRTLLSDDLETYADRTGSLDEQGWNAFGEIVGAAFYRAVGEKFGLPKTPLEADADDEDGAARAERLIAIAQESHDVAGLYGLVTVAAILAITVNSVLIAVGNAILRARHLIV